MRKTALFAAVLTTVAATHVSAADLPGKGITVKPAQSTISEETFQTLLVSRALEKLGYTVEKPSEVDYNVAYTTIAGGDATFIATNWQPLHDDMYKAPAVIINFIARAPTSAVRPGLSDRQENRRSVSHHQHRAAERSEAGQTV